MILTRLLSFLFLICFSGCLRTDLVRSSIDPDIFRLAAVNQNPWQINVSSMLKSNTLGHQFLFVFIPFGTIKIDTPEIYLLRSSYGLLAETGITPVTSQDSRGGRKMKTLKLELEEASLTAYDFIFFRRISCRVQIRGSILSPDSETARTWVATGRHQDNRKYAFKPQLLQVLNNALKTALIEIFHNLGLSAS